MDNGEINYRRYLEGDDNGIVEIIREYKDGLLLYLIGISGSFSSAEELMEETFFKLAVKKPKFRGKSSFKTWLYAIGRNAAIDFQRKNKKFSDRSFEEYSEIASAECLETNYLRKEQKIALHRAIRMLNSDYQQILTLTYFENMRTEEAAAVMGKSKKQIGNLLYRAKQALRTELEKEGFEYEKL